MFNNHPLEHALNKVIFARLAQAMQDRVRGRSGVQRLAWMQFLISTVMVHKEDEVVDTNTRTALLGIASECDMWLYMLDEDGPALMIAEYDKAKAKHGDRTLDGDTPTDEERFMALAEELGEIARACTYDEGDKGNLVTEIAQTGALALAWLTRLNKQHEKEKENA